MTPMLNARFDAFGWGVETEYSLGPDWFRNGRNRVVLPSFSLGVIGARVWVGKGRKIHRRGGPALEIDNGVKIWYLNGDKQK
jgi:hypothetical protein